ncbi:MAG: spinster family MFS transporter [Thermoanaerobaculia bacterium]
MQENNPGISLRGARAALLLLTGVNLLNYLDRYVVSALVESLRHCELHLTDPQLGLLMSSFLVVYLASSPIFGIWGDTGRRPRLIAAGVALWSGATALGGFARSFGQLLFARSAVGIGEASYGTIAPALLSDAFPPHRRGRVMSIFYSALPVGAAAGYIAGGLLDRMFGWRAAFLLAGCPGLLLAFFVSRLPEFPRETSPDEPGPWASFAGLARNRPYRRVVLGYAAYTFALGALAFWTPAFLERARGMSRSEATVQFGLIVVATGFAGTFAGGWLADFLRRRTPQSDLWVCGVATLAAAPVVWVAFTSPNRAVSLAAITIAEVLLFLPTGPANSAILGAAPAGRRATAMALSIFAIHLLGDVPSPLLLGVLSQATSLQAAFRWLPAPILLAGAIWCFAASRGSGAYVELEKH